MSYVDENDTFDYRSVRSFLTDWHKSQLSQVDSKAGVLCLLKIWFSNSSVQNEEPFCNSSWDYVYCWPSTPPETVITKPCSEMFQSLYPQYASYLKGNAKRECLKNGTWLPEDQGNYEECELSYKLYLEDAKEENFLRSAVHHMLFYGSILSLISLGVSLAIFYHFRCLRCERVTVHAHLMLSLVLRSILMFVLAEPFVLNRTKSYKDMDILCESILVLFLYSTFSSVSWMFNQGLYLNISLMAGVISINNRYHLWIYYIIGWVVPGGFIFVYVIAMLLRDQEKCWRGYSEMTEMWILVVPVIFELTVNGIFLLNILRILLRKVRNSHSRQDSSQIKAASKATAILFPVLGLNNLIFFYNPGEKYNKYMIAVNTFFGSTQGIFVAIVYCFNNKEVWSAIGRSFRRTTASRFINSHRPETSEHHNRTLGGGLILSDLPRRTTSHSNNNTIEQAV